MEATTFLLNAIKHFSSESMGPRCELSGWNPAEQLETKMIVVVMVMMAMVVMSTGCGPCSYIVNLPHREAVAMAQIIHINCTEEHME